MKMGLGGLGLCRREEAAERNFGQWKHDAILECELESMDDY